MSYKYVYRYSIDNNTYDSCVKFANDSYLTSSNHIRKRNQSNSQRIIEQITAGKIGEWATFNYLKDSNINCSLPDMKIYAARKKSFAADLNSLERGSIHVKSQEIQQALRYGLSWMFQYSSVGGTSGHHDPILTSPDGIIAFCCVDVENKYCDVIGFLTSIEAIKHIELPEKNELKNSKRVIYYDIIRGLVKPI